jgi:micrococcal nuclease
MSDMPDLYTYRVASYRVVDGDTLDVSLDLGFSTFRREKIRLARINAPEMKTEAGPVSKSHLSDILDGKDIVVKTMKDRKDRYGRYIAEVWVGLKNVNDLMVADNAAVYQEY